MGKGKAQRVEDLLTRLNTENPGEINREGMRRARRAAKSLTKAEDQESVLKRYAKAFLPGRKVSFSFGDIVSLARKSSGNQALA